MTVKAHLMRAVAMLGLSAGAAAAAESPLGVWIDHTGRGAIEITACGDGKLCGRLVWIKDGIDQKACGTEILGEVGPEADGAWDGGWIYSPEKKSKYDVELTPQNDGKLTVLGYAGTKLFSQEMTWTRAPADLKRCDVQEAKALPKASDSTPGSAIAAAAEPKSDSKVVPAEPPKVVPDAANPDKKIETAQADVAAGEPSEPSKPQAKAEPKPKVAKRSKTRMCRVDAPFVRVEFPCDDD